ncbi:hypothetical protein [Streptomyces sp. ECR3.8]|uniref:hypothetical protein n=1 Tax=Streptomyces sp. ECR3.8 TaxID=3461009 RepID=UPI004041E77C
MMDETIRHARRFVIRQPGQPDIHGIQFPSGRVIYDQPSLGLEAAMTIQDIRIATLDASVAETPNAAVHWADEADTTA